MFKLAGRILDPYDDPNFGSDAEVKAAGFMPAAEVAKLPDSEFALIIKTASGKHRFYPIATPHMAKLSAAYFARYGHQLPAEDREKVVSVLRREVGDEFIEPRSPDVAPGQPVEDVAKLASVALNAYLGVFDRMTPGERACAAAEMAELDIDDPRVTDYLPSVEFGALFKQGMLERRAALADSPEGRAALDQVAVKLAAVGAVRGAFILDEFDQMMKIGKRVTDAYRTTWGGKVKRAKSKACLEHDYKVETLAKLHADEIRSVFAEPIAEAFIRDPKGFYAKATGQVKAILKKLVDSVGVKRPVAEVSQGQVSHARDSVRSGSGEFHPWSHS